MASYNVPLEEQETIVNFGRTDEDMTIYTTDSTTITKLDKAVKAGLYEVIELHTVKGVTVGKTYKAKKKLLSFRVKEIKRELTEEQRKKIAEQFRKNR